MQPAPLDPIAARAAAAALREELGRADHPRLDQVLSLLREDGRARLADVLAALYPDKPRTDALTAFRQFRERISAAADAATRRLALCVDTQTRADPGQRWCWFEGDDPAAGFATQLTRDETQGVARTHQNAFEPEAPQTVRYFVCYAHDDAPLKERLLRLLQPRLATAAGFRFKQWHDRDIILGENWRAQIEQAIADCDFGLLLVSNAFLCSDFIAREELPHFVAHDPFAPAPDKPVVPVAIESLVLDATTNLRGLERIQIYFDAKSRSFQQCRDRVEQKAFADGLRAGILRKLATPKAAAAPRPFDFAATLREHVGHELADVRFVRSRVRIDTLERLETQAAQERPDEEGRDALDFLGEWLHDPKGQPYCALLGEYGMGKTTNSMAFAKELLDARVTDPALPLPIYLDLRYLGDAAKSEPLLPQIIDTVLARSWRGGQTEAKLTAEEVVRLVQQEGALAIFDGLDEVLVHLSPAGGKRFTRELFRILPPTLWPAHRNPELPGRPGRVLVTCRTHYFRTLREQKAHLAAEDRDAIGADAYRVFVLLPFTDQQIRDYLAQTLPGEDIERALETIRAVHNLPELAERPYTLSLIARHFPQIEQWKMQGRRVTGVDLYRHMAASWLEHDGGKHTISPPHKQMLMEHLAAALHRSGKRSWTVDDLEDWLIAFFVARPAIAAHYEGVSRDLLKEDLRTATFLVRDGEADFRFAHTSLQEFFLAAWLHRALLERRPEDWDLPRPSPETLDFLGQMLASAPDDRALATLRSLRGTYRPRISELAFAYVLLATPKGHPAVSPAGFRLDGADLRGWRIAGTRAERLNLRGASFHAARLDGAAFAEVDLDDADFSAARLQRVEVIGGRARRAAFAGADLTGTIFRDLALDDAAFTHATFHRTQFQRCGLHGVRGLPESSPLPLRAQAAKRTEVGGGVRRAPPSSPDTAPTARPDPSPQPPPTRGAGEEILLALCDSATPMAAPPPQWRTAVLDGHVGAALACAWSPDGARLASAGTDGTLRLWDAATGELLAALRGHTNWVRACAWSPDGARLVSASVDGTVRLWDATTAEPLAILRGHANWVRACAWSPDGARLASAGDDRTLRLWDAATGEPLAALRGHEGWVSACAWSPDGARLASASLDGTLRLWDAATGEPLAALRRHEGEVYDCAWSPDGARLAGAGMDGTLLLWDAATGEPLAALRGHETGVRGVWACAWSPDGARLASAGVDGTLRLWDAATGEPLAILRGHANWVQACAWSPDGARLASAGMDGTLRLWDAATGEPLAALRGNKGAVLACAWSPNGARLASAGRDGTLRLWDATTAEPLAALRRHEGEVLACAWSPDGARLASAGYDDTLRLWDASTGEPLATLRGHAGAVEACAWSPDGARLASAGADGTLRLWDAATGEPLAALRGHEGWVLACAWSPDGARLASAGRDGTLRLWDAATGEPLAALRGHENGMWACAWSPDGARLASAGQDGTLRLWDAATREPLATLRGHAGAVRACAWSPDGTRLASAGFDGTLRLWDATTGEPLAALRGHANWVHACVWSPDGARLASAGHDGTLRLWDATSLAPIGFIAHALPNGASASLTPDGSRILAVTGDAWRYLGWYRQGHVERFPAEIFGPLPTFPAAARPRAA
jgi:WD40 repeat protein/uncharacterized protein YjbI with pentapeptide repeats